MAIDSLIKLKARLRRFRHRAETLKEEQEKQTRWRDEITDAMLELDADNRGIVVFPEETDGTAFRQQSGAPKTWDVEGIVEWLHDNGMWDRCSTQTFDPQKWEAEIAAGNIPATTVKRFVNVGKRPAAYIKWGKEQPNSIRAGTYKKGKGRG